MLLIGRQRRLNKPSMVLNRLFGVILLLVFLLGLLEALSLFHSFLTVISFPSLSFPSQGHLRGRGVGFEEEIATNQVEIYDISARILVIEKPRCANFRC